MERSLLATRLVNEPVPIRLTTPMWLLISLFNEISNHKLLLVATNPPSTIKPYIYVLAVEKISLGFGCISNFGDLISSTLQLIEVELVLWETAKIGNVLKYSDIHVKFGTASMWNQSYFMVLYTRIGNFVWPYLPNYTIYGHETCSVGQRKDGVLRPYHQLWSYEPMNVHHISWTLVCMGRGGFVPANSYIKIIFIIDLELHELIKWTLFLYTLVTFLRTLQSRLVWLIRHSKYMQMTWHDPKQFGFVCLWTFMHWLHSTKLNRILFSGNGVKIEFICCHYQVEKAV